MSILESEVILDRLNLPDIENFSEQIDELKKTIESLEKNYTSDSSSADAACDYNNILVIADKVQEFANNRQFYQLYNALTHGLDELTKLLKNHQKKEYLLSKENLDYRKKIFDCFKENGEQLTQAFDIFSENQQKYMKIYHSYFFKKNFEISNLSKTKLMILATSLEKYGDVLEDLISFLTIERLQSIQSIIIYFIEKSQKKFKKIDPDLEMKIKEAYRIRIRNAAGFIYKLIDCVIEDTELEEQEMLEAVAKANHPVFFE